MASPEQKQVIILVGPPHSGKTDYCCDELQHAARVAPSEEFHRQPDLNIRQMVFQNVLPKFREKPCIVLDDCNWEKTRREAYINLIKKKWPNCIFCCITVEPDGGAMQMLWAMEHKVALVALLGSNQPWDELSINRSEAMIQAWLGKPHPTSVTPPELPDADEFSDLKSVRTKLSVQSVRKFDIPGLLIDWEGVVTGRHEDMTLGPGISKVIATWHRVNPGGCVIILRHAADAMVAVSDFRGIIKSVLPKLAKDINICPVYMLFIEDLKSGTFSVPPQPGMIALVQRFCHLDLFHTSTMYLYHTASHMRMAEAAGVKHLKISRALEKNHLVKTSHATHQGPQPAILKDIKFLPIYSDVIRYPDAPPLYQDAKNSESYVAEVKIPCGRWLYLAAKDKAQLEKFEKLYKEGKDTVAEAGGSSQDEDVPDPGPSWKTQNVTITQRSNRGLPDWMRREASKSKDSKTSGTPASHSSPVKSPRSSKKKSPRKEKPVSSKAIYVMSESELVQAALDVLKEAGRSTPTEEEIADLRAESDSVSTKTRQPQPSTSVSYISAQQTFEDDGASTDEEDAANDQTINIGSSGNHQTRTHVPDTSSEGTSSSRPDISVCNSLVSNTSSNKTSDRPDITVGDSLVGSSKSSEKSPPNRQAITIADSLVPSTKSTDSSKRSTVNTHVSESSSGSKRSHISATPSKSTGSSKHSVTIADSHVSDTPSGSKQSSHESSTASKSTVSSKHTIADSHISDSTSSRSTNKSSNRTGSTVPDSIVSNTSSSKQTDSRSSKSIPDSLVKDSSSSRSQHLDKVDVSVKESSSDKSGKSEPRILVPDTVMTVPETRTLSFRRQDSEGANIPTASLTRPGPSRTQSSKSDIESFLDNLL